MRTETRTGARAALRLGALATALVVLAALGGCAALSSEPDPTQIRIDDMDRRLGGVERVVNNQSLVQLAQRIDELTAQVRTLRGQVEELQNTQEQLRAQQRSLYADIDKRTAALEARDGLGGASAAPGVTSGGATPGGGTSGSAPAGMAQANPPSTAPTAGERPVGSPEQRYGAAFDALKTTNYPAAIAGFGAFLRDFPQHALADNAQYWLGEAYYVTRDYDKALTAFMRVGQLWPDSRKAPDAALKLGYTQFELKRFAAARATLAGISSRWPGTEAARLAQDRLKRMPATP